MIPYCFGRLQSMSNNIRNEIKLTVKTVTVFKRGTSAEVKLDGIGFVLDLVNKERWILDGTYDTPDFDVYVLKKYDRLPSSLESRGTPPQALTLDNLASESVKKPYIQL